jgi:carbamate kinase
VVITHGNGPQVGHMLTRVEAALGKAYAIPLEVCVAESEGELGYVLEQTLYNLLAEWRCSRPIASLLTQVVVHGGDPAFANPTKPVGPFYDEGQASELRQQGFVVRDDAGRGYRRMVPSPAPLEIVDVDVVRTLLDAGALVICAGGGGIPVVREGAVLRGVEAVIDKDLTSALLGESLDSKFMLILTGVPCAYRDFNTPRQAPLGCLSAQAAHQLLTEGHFLPGSMGPKIEAAIRFASRPGATAIICDPLGLADALEGKAGTIIRSID